MPLVEQADALLPSAPRNPAELAPDVVDLLEELELALHADPGECARRATAAAQAAAAAGDDAAEMRLSWFAAVGHHLRGRDAAALAAADRARSLAEDREDLVWQARALAARALVHHDLGDVEDAVDLLRRAVELSREAQDPAATAEILNHLGTVYTDMFQFAPEATQVLTEARQLWLAAGDPDRASIALTSLAANYVVTSTRIARTNARGALAAGRRALTVAQQAVDEADAAGLCGTAIEARIAVVGACMLLGDLDGAGVALATTASMLERFPAPRQQLALHRVRSAWLVACGLPDDAAREVAAGLAMCERLDRPAERLELLRTLVAAREAAGDTAGALATLHDVHDLVVEHADAVAARRAVLLASRLEVERAERLADVERRRAQALEARNASLAYEATHDALTGLANRRALDVVLAARVEGPDRPFAVALVDVDHFKRVNDECSHQVGDQVLARLGDLLGHAVRDDDLAARYGGEEFALVLAGATPEVARGVCDRVRASVAALGWDQPIPGDRVTVSIGVAVSTDASSVAELLARADAALYRAKEGGRDRVEVAG